MKEYYKIYYLDNKGMLEEPMRWGEAIYGEYESQEQALNAIKERKATGDYIILPFISLGWADYEEDK